MWRMVANRVEDSRQKENSIRPYENFSIVFVDTREHISQKLIAIIDGKKDQIIHSLMPYFRVKQTPPPPKKIK
jgi:hypothetical protein